MSSELITDYLLEGVDFISQKLELTRSQVVDFLYPAAELRPRWLMRIILCSNERIAAEQSVCKMISNGFWRRSSFWEYSSRNVRGTNWAKTYAKAITSYPTVFLNRTNGWEQDPVVYNALYALLTEWRGELSDYLRSRPDQVNDVDFWGQISDRKRGIDESVKILERQFRSRLIYEAGNGFRAHIPIKDGYEDTRAYRDAPRIAVAKNIQTIYNRSLGFKLVQYGEPDVAQCLAALHVAESRLYDPKREGAVFRCGFNDGDDSKMAGGNMNLLMEIVVRIWLVRLFTNMGWTIDHEKSIREIGKRTVLCNEGGLTCEIMKSGIMELDLLSRLRKGGPEPNGFQPDVVLLFSKKCEGVRRGFMVLADSKNYEISGHDVADRAMILYLMAFHWAVGLQLAANFPKTEEAKDFYPFEFNPRYESDRGLLFFPSIESDECQRRLISHFQLGCLKCSADGCGEPNCSKWRLRNQFREMVCYLESVSGAELPLVYTENGRSSVWQYDKHLRNS